MLLSERAPKKQMIQSLNKSTDDISNLEPNEDLFLTIIECKNSYILTQPKIYQRDHDFLKHFNFINENEIQSKKKQIEL